nr:uncharacterized protein LOC106688235 [Halyomorpha halys]
MHLERMHHHHHHRGPGSRLTESQDEALVTAVGQFPALYDLRHEDYKNRKVRTDLWDNIALSLGRDVETCKKRWRDIKDNYYKIKRKQKMGNCKWPLVGKLAFLDSVAPDKKMGHRFERGAFQFSFSNSSPLTEGGNKRQDIAENQIVHPSPSTSKSDTRHQDPPKQQDDDVDLFMQSIALQVKKLPPQLVARAKLNILTTVHDLQFETSVNDQNLVIDDV